MSLIKQNLSLKAVNYLELALEEFLNKYKPIMDDKHIYELNKILFQTRQIKLAASIYQEGIENNQLSYEEKIINIEKAEKTFSDIIKEFLNRR